VRELITYYRTFDLDQRVSMEIYADRLSQALIDHIDPVSDQPNSQTVTNFRPASPQSSMFKSKFGMRFLRYFWYPRQVKNSESKIHHIVDHGYAHLVKNLGAGAKIVTVHDLIPSLAWRGLIQGVDKSNFRKPRLNLYSLSFVQEFDHVIAISGQTKHDLLEYSQINESRVTVVPPVIDQAFSYQKPERVAWFKQKYGLSPDKQYVLLVGGSFYKNQERSLRALKRLCQYSPDLRIIKTGVADPEFEREVVSNNLTQRVQTLYIEDSSELPLLYASVDCLLFASLYEGFGMPVIEALACGCPVVTTNAGALSEFNDNWVYRVDPLDEADIAEKVEKALQDNCAQANVVQDDSDKAQDRIGLDHELTKYREKAVAQSMFSVYQKFL
jgi:glycosyltransferase involved in cell wall biosynthesis